MTQEKNEEKWLRNADGSGVELTGLTRPQQIALFVSWLDNDMY